MFFFSPYTFSIQFPIAQQYRQAAMLSRLSLSMCLWSGSSTVEIGEPYSAYCRLLHVQI